MKHILIVDDERGSRESLRAVFSNRYRVSPVASAAEAAEVLAATQVDLILLDVLMPEKDGVSFLKEIRAQHPDVPVIMVSASAAVRPVVESMRIGAIDYVIKPFDVAEIRRIADRAIESFTLQRRVNVLQTEVSREFPVDRIIGESPVFRKTLEEAQKAAETDATVLLYGESGTGKELVARLIHSASGRRDEPFVAVHCAALPETLLESELFGYEKGAFTSADKRKAGRFDLAGSGSLFFDEIGEMSLSTQVKLLRVLQEREFMRVGGTRLIQTNARIIAATARDLRKEVAERRFRDDLYYRISVVPIYLPPLRERPDDIPVLARYFLSYFRGSLDAATSDFEPETLGLLCRYPWPGNVREMRNIIERMLVLHGRSPTVRPESLPEEFHARPAAAAARAVRHGTLEDAVNAFERDLIEEALREADGVQTKAATILGTTRRILKYRMEKLSIPAKPESPSAGSAVPSPTAAS